LSGCLWFFSSEARSSVPAAQEAPTANIKLPVTTIQIRPEGGVTPVELTCGEAALPAPNAIQTFACTLKNNTTKAIRAGAYYTTVVVERGGEDIATSDYTTFDSLLHPDFREDHPNNLIPPGGTIPYRELPTTYEDDATVKSITIQIDYVEFADASAVGPNKAGSRLIGDIRTGAARYKDWLAQKFSQHAESFNTVLQLLDEGQALPGELRFASNEEAQGARMYRKYLLKKYKDKGEDAVTKHLKLTNAPAHK
jgi:hypothetical protein